MSRQVEVPEGVRKRIRALCLALPEVGVRVDEPRVRTRSTAWSFDIRRRSFCLLMASEDSDGRAVTFIVVRAEAVERDALLAVGHPYFAERGGPDRLGVTIGPDTDWEEVGEFVTESYRMLAPKKLIRLLD